MIGSAAPVLDPGSATSAAASVSTDDSECDFDGDGFEDLAIGVPRDGIHYAGGVVGESGAVNVLYGSGVGPTAEGNQWWYQDLPEVLGGSEWGDGFGTALACGDFDGDGFDDPRSASRGRVSGRSTPPVRCRCCTGQPLG